MDIELWVRIIKEGIKTKKINPWDINIEEVADFYINKIKELKRFDIKLSADVILVASILLRMKSEYLYNQLNPKKEKKVKKRCKKEEKINEEKLIKNVKRELKKIKKKNTKKEVIIYNIDDIVDEMIEEENIEKIIEELYNIISKKREIIYQEVFKNKDDKIKYFIPSLYLAYENKIEIIQENIFDEIILRKK